LLDKRPEMATGPHDTVNEHACPERESQESMR
jgi:hypothetical protein